MIYLRFLLLLLVTSSFGQSTFIGRILNKNTNEPILGVSIYSIITPSKGTISNENGEFMLKMNENNEEFIFSHIAFEKVKVKISANSNNTVYLNPASFTLPEATVGNPAITLINLVIKKAIGNKNEEHFSKAFYQKTSVFQGDYTKLHEMFFEMSWTTEGVRLWHPMTTRYAEKKSQSFTHQKYIFSCFLKTKVFSEYKYYPLNTQDPSQNYNFKIMRYLNEGTDSEIAVVNCKPNNSFKNFTSFTGDLYIDTQNEILLKIDGIFKVQGSSKWHNTDKVEVAFEKINGRSQFKYLHLVSTSKKSFSNKKNIEKGWIYSMEPISNFSSDKLFKENEPEDDRIFFKNAKYVKSFWDIQVPIFHTQLEKEIIAYFEKTGNFIGNL
jgi:hypothetical protein